MSTATAAGAHAQNTNAKPIFVDGDEAVFLNTRTAKSGANAGETYDIYTYTKGRGPDALRIDVPVSVSGYDLRNSVENGHKISDVVDLVHGRELLVTLSGRPKPGATEGRPYDVLIGALPVVEKPARDNPDKVFRTLPLVVAFAEFAKEDVNREKPRAFTINGLDEAGKEVREKNLKSYRFVAPPRDQQREGRPVWVKITLADAVAARSAVAQGKPFEFERDGCVVRLDGLEKAEKVPGLTVMRWKCELLERTKGAENQAPLPAPRQTTAARTR